MNYYILVFSSLRIRHHSTVIRIHFNSLTMFRKVICNRKFTMMCIRFLTDKTSPSSSSPSSSTPPHTSTTPHTASKATHSTAHSTAEAIKIYTADLNKAYAEIEKKMMERIRESNQNRFRLLFFGSSLAIIWIFALFGGQIRKMLSDQTADIARETLENESIKVQTNELAVAVIQTILNDKEITMNASKFLREAVTTPETQHALLSLTLHILQHNETIKELTVLVKHLLTKLTKDEVVKKQIAELLSKSFNDPVLKKALVELVIDLCKDPEVMKSVTDMVLEIIAQKSILNATNELLIESTQAVIADQQIISQSRQFVSEVVGDDSLQREGGNALWNSITHAIRPGLFSFPNHVESILRHLKIICNNL